jgi:hypothetical protein
LGAFVWVVIPIGVQIEPPTYQKATIKAFHEYIDVFMKIFLDDFVVFTDMSIHLENSKNVF